MVTRFVTVGGQRINLRHVLAVERRGDVGLLFVSATGVRLAVVTDNAEEVDRVLAIIDGTETDLHDRRQHEQA